MYGQKPSKSADAGRRRYIEALKRMPPYQRVILALSLKERMKHVGKNP